MTSPRRSQIETARRKKHLVRFKRRFENPTVRGYVLKTGPRFFLLALVSDRIWFDGYECFRIGDVYGWKKDPYADFVEAALRERKDEIDRDPGVSVDDVRALLTTAGRAFPLVAIHRESVDPDVCWIGSVSAVGRSHVSLLEVAPDATWHTVPTDFGLNEITRVNFGGDYEDALHLVAGKPPAKPRRHPGRL